MSAVVAHGDFFFILHFSKQALLSIQMGAAGISKAKNSKQINAVGTTSNNISFDFKVCYEFFKKNLPSKKSPDEIIPKFTFVLCSEVS